MKINQILFAVTDQNVLIRLVVTDVRAEVQDLNGWLEVTTELADEDASRHQLTHHQAYFRKLFIEPDGKSSRAGVFELKESAIQYAEKSIQSKLRHLQSQMDALTTMRAKLRST